MRERQGNAYEGLVPINNSGLGSMEGEDCWEKCNRNEEEEFSKVHHSDVATTPLSESYLIKRQYRHSKFATYQTYC